MPLRSIWLLTLLTPSFALAEIPQTIVGTWHMDVGRSPCLEDDPEHSKCSAAFTVPCQTDIGHGPHELIFTNSTISQGDNTAPYRVLGGNSALVIVESTDETGATFVTNIRLIDGGIAMQSLDCRAHREKCERSHKQAMQKITRRSSTVEIAQDNPSVLVDGLLPPEFNTPPLWVYFRGAQDPICNK